MTVQRRIKQIYFDIPNANVKQCNSKTETMTKFILLICFLIVAIVVVAHGEADPVSNSEADADYVCPDSFEPVCGNDGITYTNKCAICCAFRDNRPDLRIEGPGECGNRDLVVCIDTYEPVCGDDGITYENSCRFIVHSPCGTEFTEGACVSA